MTDQYRGSGFFRRACQRILEVSQVAVAIRYDAPWGRSTHRARQASRIDGDDHAPDLPAIMGGAEAWRPC